LYPANVLFLCCNVLLLFVNVPVLGDRSKSATGALFASISPFTHPLNISTNRAVLTSRTNSFPFKFSILNINKNEKVNSQCSL